ncbi:MAG: ABC transporter permease, partial [Bacteroidota bacterium]
MVQHNLKIAYRSFLKHKSSFVINLIGLSSGLACSLLIYLWVMDEMTMDQFHQNDKRLYQVLERHEQRGQVGVQRSTPWLLAETLKKEMPEVEYAAVVTPAYWFPKFTLKSNDKVIKADGQYVGTDFFNVFSFNIIHGNKNEVLTDKNSIVISEELALRLFNSTSDALGQNIVFQQESEYTVTGVFEDIGHNSSLQFDFVLSVDLVKDMQPHAFDWKNAGPHSFVVLREGSDTKAFNKKITKFISDRTEDKHRTPFITIFSSNYLYGDYENGIQSGGRVEYVQLFSLIAAFILIIACINFMNLATARASRRIKEVGVKKAMGVSRKLLIVQYITESTLLVFLALITSLVLVGLLLPHFNIITGKQLSLQFDAELIISMALITLATGILAGSYPALYLSKFRPSTVLKGKLNKNVGELWIRKGLVIFQFTLSVIFISSIMIIYKQIEFIQTKSIGYNKENVIHFEVEGNISSNLETFINELEKVPGVLGASSAGQSMVGGGNTSNIKWEGKDPELISNVAFRP